MKSSPPPAAQLSDNLTVDASGWHLTETGSDPDRAVAVGSNFLAGNGYLGYRGTSPEQGAADYVALVVSDTYDCADGHWVELTTAPNPLFVRVTVAGESASAVAASDLESTLDLRSGEYGVRFSNQIGGATVRIAGRRFASYDDLHLLAQQVVVSSDDEVTIALHAGIDADIWSLNGTHLPQIELGRRGTTLVAAGRTVESGVEIAVAAAVTVSGGGPTDWVLTGRQALDGYEARLTPGQEVVLETVAAVYSSNDVADPVAAAVAAVAERRMGGYEDLAAASRRCWDAIWDAMDVVVDGDITDQAALRFSAYHNRICTPAHSDRLPIGARGLSCQAYQGSAFWDQEIYNLPAFLFTEPDIARSILVYRHRTLDGARRKAARLGYAGAYYAWISGLTGDELCPDYFFADVLTGRPIRNHFNVWQMHVAPDVVTTVARYVEVTGDEQFLVDHGAEIAFEVARFLWSFVRYDEWRGVYHCIRLLGPDEWHENVDDNAFTNYQVRAALDFAVSTYQLLAEQYPAELAALRETLGLAAEEVDRWRRVRDRIFLPQPHPETGLIEQFDGFFDLEDVTPAEVAPRLLDPNEYWGWPNGVAVATQVSKQADVAVLLWQQPQAFDDAVARANYDYYEPRCSHNSSLSHAVYGFVAAHIGEAEVAHRHFVRTATIDLLNTNHPMVGGTFIGGIHTAACGGTYQLAVQGLGGLGFSSGRLTIDPALPPDWRSISYPVSWRGNRLRITASHDGVTITADPGNVTIEIEVRGSLLEVSPGAEISVR
jgi:kojibiose phosphorylase